MKTNIQWVPGIFLRFNRPVGETNFSAQPNTNHLQNTVPMVAVRQPILKQRSVISHVPKEQLLFPLYSTSLLSVPMFTETLRKYPIVPFPERTYCSEYELPTPNGNGTKILPADTGVYILVSGLHFDATYFPEPEKFDPDCFTEENKHSRPNNTYLPFGEGPLMCIVKDRQLIFPHKNFRFRLLRILIVLLLQPCRKVW